LRQFDDEQAWRQGQTWDVLRRELVVGDGENAGLENEGQIAKLEKHWDWAKDSPVDWTIFPALSFGLSLFSPAFSIAY